MHELGLFERKNKVYVSSRIIAERFEKRHDNVITTIEGLIKDSRGCPFEKEAPEFIEQSYIHPQNGQEYREYVINKRAFVLVMMRLKGEIAFVMQNRYIDAFESMEAALAERQTTDWLKTRENGKLIRRNETDAIQQLIPYAEEQGSKNMAKQAYRIYSKMVNKIAGVETGERDKASYKQLMTIAMLEDMIQHTIQEEMKRDVYYKKIYQICKQKAEQFAGLMYLSKAM